jgi:NAD dependent epimerase/dehydratase family enzyme
LNAFLTIIEDESCEGIYNLTAPNPTTNRELTKALGRVLNRPTFFRVPFFVLKQKFGEGAQVLTKGQSAIPQRLLDRGFTFRFPEIEGAIRDLVT